MFLFRKDKKKDKEQKKANDETNEKELLAEEAKKQRMEIEKLTRTTPEEAIREAASKGHVYPPITPENQDDVSVARVQEGDTTLSKEELVDRIKGVIFGNCLGDAVGLATEFMSKEQAEKCYKRPLNFADFVPDSHRVRFPIGDWTDDSDQMILIIDAVLRGNGTPSASDYAERLLFWIDHGFAEIGDLCGLGLGATTRRVTDHPDFIKNPHKCSQQVWEASGKTVAPNGGVMRTSVLGIVNFGKIDTVIENAINICKVTHADPRCIASCVVVTTLIASILQGKYKPEDIETLKTLKKAAIEEGVKIVGDVGKTELLKFAEATSFEQLALGNPSGIGYTYKALGAGLYCFEYYNDFEEGITDLTFEAGDADTNGAVAGALLGAKLGYSKLPKRWLEGMPHVHWLEKRVDALLKLMGLL